MRRALLVLVAACHAAPRPAAHEDRRDVVVLVSATSEWRAVAALFPSATAGTQPWGETLDVALGPQHDRVLFVHGGWGKIAAAGSAQYAIDRWHPSLLVNLGTCGGFAGAIDRFATVLVARTVVYDIVERMGDPREAIDAYATDIDLTWLGPTPPSPAVRATLVSGDQDLDPSQIARLRETYGAVAGDWESGSIAYVAARNHVRVLILRGVSDVVAREGDETYGHEQVFTDAAARVMRGLVDALPAWLERRTASR